MIWYSHLFENFPQFVVIHMVKGFGVVNKAEVDVFLELSCFPDDPADVGDLISGSSVWLPTDDGLIECGPPIQNNATRILLVRYSTPKH